jgi:hypothetical protein
MVMASLTRIDGDVWGIFDSLGYLLFDEYDRAHVYWSRASARNAVANKDWSGFPHPPHVGKLKDAGQVNKMAAAEKGGEK